MNWWQAILHHPARQPDRARPDDAQRPRRHAATASRSRSSPAPSFGVTRRQRARAPARPRGLRLVRDPDLDRRRRPSTRCSKIGVAGRRREGVPGGVWIAFLAFWAWNMYIVVEGHRVHQVPRGLGRAVPASPRASRSWPGPWCAAGGLGPILARPSRLPDHGRVHALLHPVAHGDGRLLGHARRSTSRTSPRYAREPEGADLGPGPRPAAHHDALRVHRRRRHLRLRRSSSARRSGTRSSCSSKFESPVVIRLADSRCSSRPSPPTSRPTSSPPPTTSPTSGPQRISFATGGIITGDHRAS